MKSVKFNLLIIIQTDTLIFLLSFIQADFISQMNYKPKT